MTRPEGALGRGCCLSLILIVTILRASGHELTEPFEPGTIILAIYKLKELPKVTQQTSGPVQIRKCKSCILDLLRLLWPSHFIFLSLISPQHQPGWL